MIGKISATGPVVIALYCLSTALQAQSLPPVTGVSFDGQTISWNALPNATGYNIHTNNFEYLTTVRDATSFVPLRSGNYILAGFDDAGNFSPLQLFGDAVSSASNVVTVKLTQSQLASPANVYGSVYSKTAAEIFWDRVINRSIEYDLFLNEEYVSSVSGTSFYIDTLSENTNNVVSITARSSDGSESASVSLVVDTNGNDFPYAVIDSELIPFEEVPRAPQSARLERYSNTAIELFWDRPVASEDVAITEISRDGIVIGSSVGTSFYDGSQTQNTPHQYKLVAITNEGARSSAAVVNPSAFDGTANSIVDRLLAGVSDVTANNPHSRWYALFQGMRGNSEPEGLTAMSSKDITEDGTRLTRREFQCGPGSAVIDDRHTRYGQDNLRFSSCVVGGLTLNGNMTVNQSLRSYRVDYEDLFISDGSSVSNINGTVISDGGFPNYVAVSLEYQNFNYRVSNPGEPETVVELNQMIVDNISNTPRSTFTTSFTVSALWTHHERLTVTTNNLFKGADLGNGNYTNGQLTIQADDGQRLVLDVSFPDTSGWYAVVDTASSSTGIIGFWNDQNRLPCRSVAQQGVTIPNCF